MKARDTLPNDETLDLEQASDYLHLGRDATRELFDRGELPGVSLNQKHLVFRRPALDAFLARVEAEQTKARAIAHQARMAAANDPVINRRSSRRRKMPSLDGYD